MRFQTDRDGEGYLGGCSTVLRFMDSQSDLLSSQKHLSIREVAAVVMETSQLVLSQFKNF